MVQDLSFKQSIWSENCEFLLNCRNPTQYKLRYLIMIDFVTICEFSRQNCIAICAFLVPANLLATSLTLIFLWFRRPLPQLKLSAMVATGFAVVLVLHVYTWFMIGVLRPVSFILVTLASVCLLINGTGVAYRQFFVDRRLFEVMSSK